MLIHRGSVRCLRIGRSRVAATSDLLQSAANSLLLLSCVACGVQREPVDTTKSNPARSSSDASQALATAFAGSNLPEASTPVAASIASFGQGSAVASEPPPSSGNAAASAPAANEPPAVCGDGVVAPTEQCDDANEQPGDGCGITCLVDVGWICPPSNPCVPNPACLEPSLADAGQSAADASTLSPSVDAGRLHNPEAGTLALLAPPDESMPDLPPMASSPVIPDLAGTACGDGIVGNGEECDFVYEGRGCTVTCLAQEGWGCSLRCAGETCSHACVQAPTCGNLELDPNEACEDNNLRPGDGCSENCQLEPNWACPLIGHACVPAERCSPSPAPACGDGVLNAPAEECDLGAERNGGSYGTCTETCTFAPRCGDGVVQTREGEECDDGNRRNHDGCNVLCEPESVPIQL